MRVCRAILRNKCTTIRTHKIPYAPTREFIAFYVLPMTYRSIVEFELGSSDMGVVKLDKLGSLPPVISERTSTNEDRNGRL